MIADARAAVAFLTRLPVGTTDLTAARLSRAAPWFPAVGLLVGGVMAGTRAVANLVLDPTPATVLALLAAVMVTGGLHEDGLADAADAMGAHADRERKLAILRDSRVGAYGALAIVFAVVFAVAVLAPLDDGDFARAALVGNVLGRWSTLPQALALRSAHADGSGALVRPSRVAVAAGTAIALATALVAGGLGPGAIAIATAAAVTALGAAAALRVLGGVSGDTFGAVAKLVELASYAALAAAWA
ncbi:MAG: adenosylcobinamide-GDP ribazoletransferase [Solirubrobacteraceae bacterium]